MKIFPSMRYTWTLALMHFSCLSDVFSFQVLQVYCNTSCYMLPQKEITLHTVLRAPKFFNAYGWYPDILGSGLLTLLFYEDAPILPPHFFRFGPNPAPSPFPHHLQLSLHPHCSFCCLVSLAQLVITQYLRCYST